MNANENNIVGDAANEPSILVDPTDGNKIAVGWRQFDTWQSDFRQAGCGYSTDAGVTWHFPGPSAEETHAHPRISDRIVCEISVIVPMIGD